jgi:acetyltransferase-like isoleucine patch superfamily enzyme
MTNNTLNNALDTWQAKDMALPDLNGKFIADIAKLGINLNAESSLRFCQALLWADANLDGYKLIESHSKLPEWWSERGNKLFVPIDFSGDTLPSITFHSGLPFPENATVFLNNRHDYSILLWGSHSLVYISPTARIPSGHLAVGNAFAFVGPDVRSTARLNINCRNSGAIILTKDILIGSDVKFQSDDCHAIISLSSNKRINPFGGIIIVKNHVWFGERALILGDSYVSDNCVIGASAFIRGALTPSNSILAGAPARVTRTDVTWDSRDLAPDDAMFS